MKRAGQSLIEVTIGIIVLFGVAVLIIDAAVVLFGVQANEASCRSAAAAAASGAPNKAQMRAEAVLNQFNQHANAPLISHFRLSEPVRIEVTSKPVTETDVTTGKEFSPGGAVLGNVTVSTEVEIRPFAVPVFYGGNMPLIFRCRQTAPITYMAPKG